MIVSYKWQFSSKKFDSVVAGFLRQRGLPISVTTAGGFYNTLIIFSVSEEELSLLMMLVGECRGKITTVEETHCCTALEPAEVPDSFIVGGSCSGRSYRTTTTELEQQRLSRSKHADFL